jgi:glycerophosphoryl diester phosphodiesterase
MDTAQTAWPFPLWIAHRGAGKLAPENTLAAFRLGASHGYRAFECDVKLSADGVPFLLHDATLDRTTPERGVAGERPWSELCRIDAGRWLSRSFEGECIPSLEAVARYVQSNGFALNVEIKPTPGTEHGTGQAVAAHCLQLWPAGAGPLLFSSFSTEALTGAQQVAPPIPRALLLDKLWPGWQDAAQTLGCSAVVTHYSLMDRTLIDTLHGQGQRALCYTVNDAHQVQRLLALGIDGIITDSVDRFSPQPSANG